MVKHKKEKDDFITVLNDLCHELRTPLNAIIGFCDVLKIDHPQLKDDPSTCSITKASRELVRLIDVLVNISELENDRFQLKEAPVDLVSSLRGIVDRYQESSKDKQIKTKIFVEETVNPVRLGDERVFNQVLTQVVDNAFRYTNKGEIKISISNEKRQGESHIFNLEVVDTGPGVPKGQLNKILEKFSKVQLPNEPLQEGLGLGLYMAKRFLSLVGGHILLESELDKGTKVTVSFPFPEVANAEGINIENKERDIKITDGKKVSILLVEDSEENVKLLRALLRKYPFEFTVAKNGKEGVENFKLAQPDLVLMDLNMPILDGYRATEIIRKYELINDLPHTPVVALTAYTQTDVIKKCTEVGMNAHLSKPVKKKELLRTIDYLLEEVKKAS